eukprot:107600-Rhodomonas_salina.2
MTVGEGGMRSTRFVASSVEPRIEATAIVSPLIPLTDTARLDAAPIVRPSRPSPTLTVVVDSASPCVGSA